MGVEDRMPEAVHAHYGLGMIVVRSPFPLGFARCFLPVLIRGLGMFRQRGFCGFRTIPGRSV